jgi:hypothetical protein
MAANKPANRAFARFFRAKKVIERRQVGFCGAKNPQKAPASDFREAKMEDNVVLPGLGHPKKRPNVVRRDFWEPKSAPNVVGTVLGSKKSGTDWSDGFFFAPEKGIQRGCFINPAGNPMASFAGSRSEFFPDGSQFRARFIGDVFHPVGAAIPIAGVAKVAFKLVQHGVNPRGGAVFVLLDDLMRGVPFVGQSQFHRFKQIIFVRVHAEEKNYLISIPTGQ